MKRAINTSPRHHLGPETGSKKEITARNPFSEATDGRISRVGGTVQTITTRSRRPVKRTQSFPVERRKRLLTRLFAEEDELELAQRVAEVARRRHDGAVCGNGRVWRLSAVAVVFLGVLGCWFFLAALRSAARRERERPEIRRFLRRRAAETTAAMDSGQHPTDRSHRHVIARPPLPSCSQFLLLTSVSPFPSLPSLICIECAIISSEFPS